MGPWSRCGGLKLKTRLLPLGGGRKKYVWWETYRAYLLLLRTLPSCRLCNKVGGVDEVGGWGGRNGGQWAATEKGPRNPRLDAGSPRINYHDKHCGLAGMIYTTVSPRTGTGSRASAWVLRTRRPFKAIFLPGYWLASFARARICVCLFVLCVCMCARVYVCVFRTRQDKATSTFNFELARIAPRVRSSVPPHFPTIAIHFSLNSTTFCFSKLRSPRT